MTRLHKICSFLMLLSLLFSFSSPGMALTVSEEKELGDKYLEHLKYQMHFIEDPIIVGPVRQIGKNILEGLPPQPFEYKFFVAKEDVYNAFAGPGGFIVIHSGLIEALDDENALAGIIAHEIAHVSCRHISEKLDKSKKVTAASTVGMVASVLAGFPAGALLSSAGGSSAMLAYSREDESQADEIGMQYLLRAGYSGQGLVESMKVMRSKSWFGKDQIPDYLMTHPAVEDRMINLNTWLQANPSATKIRRKIDTYPYNKMRIRLTALYSDPELALGKFVASVEKHPDLPLLRYGFGLILGRVNKRNEAVEQLTKALSLAPFDPDILRALGKAQFDAGLYPQAMDSLTSANDATPNHAEGHFWLGRVQMETGDLEGAAESMQKAKKISKSDPTIYYYLGQVYGRMNTLDRAHYYLGIYHLRTRDPENATFHLQKALSLAKDNPDLSDKIRKAIEKMEDKGKKKKDKKGKEGAPPEDSSFSAFHGIGAKTPEETEIKPFSRSPKELSLDIHHGPNLTN